MCEIYCKGFKVLYCWNRIKHLFCSSSDIRLIFFHLGIRIICPPPNFFFSLVIFSVFRSAICLEHCLVCFGLVIISPEKFHNLHLTLCRNRLLGKNENRKKGQRKIERAGLHTRKAVSQGWGRPNGILDFHCTEISQRFRKELLMNLTNWIAL